MLFTFGVYSLYLFFTLCFNFCVCPSVSYLLTCYVLLNVCSVLCAHFFDFIQLLREFGKRFVVFFDELVFIYGPAIFFSYCGY